MLSNNLLRNCPVTVADAKRAVHIYGTDVAALKDKIKKQHKVNALSIFNPTPIPDHTTKLHKNITLGIYFFYVQGMPFLRTISRNTPFCTAPAVENLQNQTIVQEFKNVIKIYTERDFKVVDIHGDQEVKCIVHDMSPTSVEIVATYNHVDEVEGSIRVFK